MDRPYSFDEARVAERESVIFAKEVANPTKYRGSWPQVRRMNRVMQQLEQVAARLTTQKATAEQLLEQKRLRFQ